MKLLVINRHRATTEPNTLDVPHLIVSIFTPGKTRPVPHTNEKTLATIWLAFHDLDREPGLSFRMTYGEPVLFNTDMAVIIKQALIDHKPQAVIVHCDAGLSRSPAIAAAIAYKYNGSDMEFWSSGMYGTTYTPNRLVYRTLVNLLHEG